MSQRNRVGPRLGLTKDESRATEDKGQRRVNDQLTNRKGTTMNDTRTIKVKADAALAQAISGKHIKRWCSTTHSNGRKYVNVTFEEVPVLGKID